MKLKLITLSILFFSSFIFSQKIITKEYLSYNLKDNRKISIHLPKNYNKNSSNFPLTFVLNTGKVLSRYVTASNKLVTIDTAPEQIIIGVETRKEDVLFNKGSYELTDQNTWFLLFLKEELLPYIEKKYRTSLFISLVGGGDDANLITTFLGEKKPIFNAYMCLNPNLPKEINSKISSYNLNNYENMDNTFYFYISNSPSNSTKRATKIKNFTDHLNTLDISNFNITFDELENSIKNNAVIDDVISRGITTIFKAYSSISSKEFNTKIKGLSAPEAIIYLENKYIEMNYLFGIEKEIRERDIVAIENIIIKNNEGEYLKYFGEFLLTVKPNSALGNFYIGKYYEISENRDKCLEHYQTAYTKIMEVSDKVSADKFYKNNIERVLTER